MTTRLEGERTRLHHAIANLRTGLDTIEAIVKDADLGGLSPQLAQCAAHGGAEVAAIVSRLWAYKNAARDAARGGP